MSIIARRLSVNLAEKKNNWRLLDAKGMNEEALTSFRNGNERR